MHLSSHDVQWNMTNIWLVSRVLRNSTEIRKTSDVFPDLPSLEQINTTDRKGPSCQPKKVKINIIRTEKQNNR